MINFEEFIGFPQEFVEKQLKKEKLDYIIVSQNSTLTKSDTTLVVNVKKENDKIILITDKFLLNI